MRRLVSWRSLVLALTAAAAVTGATVAAAEERPSRSAEANAEVAGVQVAVDPETGRLRQPTAEETRQLLRALAAHFQPAHKSVQTTQWPDGTLSAVLGEETMNVFLARVDGGGALAGACVDNVDQAAQFLQGSPALEEE